jgi:heme a synthase
MRENGMTAELAGGDEARTGRRGRVGRTALSAHKLQVGVWLFVMAGLVVLMVLVGGATRLTDSGLSITEWKPVTGVIPPLTTEAWEAELEKYRRIPEYQLINKGMSLDEFKRIYWWEWGHRFLGRLIGLVFAAGFLFFLFTRRLSRPMIPRLGLIFTLGAAQGVLGWYMVQSGLVDRVDVSQYRLAAHLGLAVLIMGVILWTAFGLVRNAPETRPRAGALPLLLGLFSALVFLQILMGGFVAGLDAGLAFTTWPLMDGQFIPDGMFPGLWRQALFEDRLTVQFIHRMGGYAVAAWALALWLYGRLLPLQPGTRRVLNILLAAVTLQVVLGVLTLIHVVPISLALIHQAGALAVFALALWALHSAAGLGTRPQGAREALRGVLGD